MGRMRVEVQPVTRAACKDKQVSSGVTLDPPSAF